MAETPNDILADVRHVTYTHWNQTEPTLVDLSLQIRRKTLNVLVGPGGSGKSTLCTLFNGEIPHLLGGKFEGEVVVAGVNTRDTEVRDVARKVGHVFQDPESMFATLTVEDEVAFGPENLQLLPTEIKRLVTDLLDKTQLAPFRDHLVWALSGGQVQKLGLAAVLAMQPELIILDEPTSNLDPAATRSVHELLLALREQGMTILLVTRELDDFLARADQLLVLERGRLIAAGDPREVLASCGEAMLQNLGIWLPETSEIGVALNAHSAEKDSPVPITVEETLGLLQSRKLLARGLVGRPPAPPAVQGERLISARSLSYTYGGQKPALADVSLDIYAGELLAIVGRNGAGKSTLARMLVGLLRPQGGGLELFGRSAAAWKVQDLANRVALVFQNPEHQFLTDTVSEEINYSLLARGVTSAAEREKAVRETLDRLGICGFENVHPFALSAGMKRRLGVATMLVCRPAVLLVDEPTYGQDKQMTQTLMALMEEIRRQGVAVVMITHDMRLVQEFASRVVVMSEGRVCFDGSPVGLFARDDVLEAANLCPTMLHQLLGALRQEGVTIDGEIRNTADFLAGLGVQPEGEAQ